MNEYFIEVDKIPPILGRYTTKVSLTRLLIEEFIASNLKIVKIDVQKANRSLDSLNHSLRKYIRKNKISSVKVYVRNKQLFLLKT